jgi:hypothetical protein
MKHLIRLSTVNRNWLRDEMHKLTKKTGKLATYDDVLDALRKPKRVPIRGIVR